MIVRLGSGNPARHYLACFRNVISECIEIFIVNLFYALCSKSTVSAPSEKSAHYLFTLNVFSQLLREFRQLHHRLSQALLLQAYPPQLRLPQALLLQAYPPQLRLPQALLLQAYPPQLHLP